MIALRALIYAVAIFVALGIISLIVAAIMRIIYSIVHRKEKQPAAQNKTEAKAAQ